MVEDDRALREALADTLALGGHAFRAVDCAEAALLAIAEEPFSLVVSDVNMPGMDGHQLLAQIRQRQHAVINTEIDANASIQGNSFTNGSGALGVNQSAGASNQQANALRISISNQPQSIDDSVLMQQNVALLNSSDPTDSAPGYRQVTTSDQAFTGSRGVIQLNQSAGVGNRMANTLSVRVAD